MLQDSEQRKYLASRRSEMRMLRWLWAVKLKDKPLFIELSQSQKIEYTSSLHQVIVGWYGHVLRKDDNHRVNRRMNYEV